MTRIGAPVPPNPFISQFAVDGDSVGTIAPTFDPSELCLSRRSGPSLAKPTGINGYVLVQHLKGGPAVRTHTEVITAAREVALAAHYSSNGITVDPHALTASIERSATSASYPPGR